MARLYLGIIYTFNSEKKSETSDGYRSMSHVIIFYIPLLCQQQDLVVADFHHAATNVEILYLTLSLLHFHAAFLQSGNQRGVGFQDLKQTVDAGELHQRDIAGEQSAAGGDNL